MDEIGAVIPMKTYQVHTVSTVRGSVMALLMASAFWFLPAPSQAAEVAQLDITGGSIELNFSGPGSVSGTFTQNGQIVMGQYQPLPNIFPPVTIAGHTFSIFTSNQAFPGTPGGAPVPTGSTAGSTMEVDLTALFAGVTSTSWPWMNTSPGMASLNIGGLATGSFDELTNAFDISWTRSFTGVPLLTSATFSLHGTAQLAAVPLPAALLLFGTGLGGLMLARAKKIPA